MKRITKKLMGGYIKDKLATSEAWALKAMLTIYNNQTDAERVIETTKEQNGVGFTGTDGQFFSSLSKQYESRGHLSDKQMTFVMKRMKKYWNQILLASNEKKLVMCMLKDGIITEEDVAEYEKQQFLKAMD